MPSQSNHHIIYLPGLGDDNFKDIQTNLLKIWSIYKVEVNYHYIGWSDKEAFQPKLDRILKEIDENVNLGKTVSLVGVSAGASAAINALALRQDNIASVVCVCGKLQNPQTVSHVRYEQNPAFKQSMDLLPASYSKLNTKVLNNVLSLHPIKDSTVPVRDTYIENAHSKTMPTIGHGLSILYALTFGSYQIVKFIKKSG